MTNVFAALNTVVLETVFHLLKIKWKERHKLAGPNGLHTVRKKGLQHIKRNYM